MFLMNTHIDENTEKHIDFVWSSRFPVVLTCLSATWPYGMVGLASYFRNPKWPLVRVFCPLVYQLEWAEELKYLKRRIR